ncbi:hypothetical protein GMMP15_640028 [Candidatus Magnetomoraceae bacterium gMMP-15]
MKYLFFLGGHDAEMLEIRNILESCNQQFIDKDLSWGAGIADYKKEIQNIAKNQVPVFIELTPNYPYPDNAILIDHHGERAGIDKKTSIEQVADLLDIKLSYHQQLISINDRGHIKAMKEWGASDEDINKIRLIDRKAQGATEEDEKLAEKSINKYKEIINNNIIIIHSLTKRSSTIIDRIYDQFEHIVIYTPDQEMHYSGTGIMIRRLEKLIIKSKNTDPSIEYWLGGALPEHGYFGSKPPISEDEIKKLLITDL